MGIILNVHSVLRIAMPRTKQYERSEVLARARDLFHARGFEETSMSELVRVMRMNRFSIYSEFGSKESLFQEAIRDYRKHIVLPRFADMLCSGSGLDSIRSYFRDLFRFLTNEEGWKGCLVTNSAIDHAPVDPAVRRQALDHFRFMEKAFRQCLERAQARGEIGPDKDPARLAKFLVLATQGLGVLTKVQLNAKEWKEHIDVILAVLEK